MGPRRGGSKRGAPRGAARGRSGPNQGTLQGSAPSQAGPSHGGPTAGNPSATTPAPRMPLPVNRSLGYQENPPDPPQPSDDDDRDARLTALRHQLAYPHALSGVRLRWYLERNNWDVNRAAVEFWQTVNNPTSIPQPNRPPGPIFRLGRTVEQERLHQVHDLQTGLRTENPNHRLGNVEMMLLHHAFNFDHEEIDSEIARRHGEYDDFEDEAARLRQPADSQLALDQRLALFLSISCTNSVYSARKLLEQHNWDLSATIEAWMKAGKVRVTFPPRASGDQEDVDDGLRGVNVNRPPRVRDGRFLFFDDDHDKFDEWFTKKRKSAGNGDGSDPDTSNPETIISAGNADELQDILDALPSTLRKRQKTTTSESRPRPQNDPDTSAEPPRSGRAENQRAKQARGRGRGRGGKANKNQTAVENDEEITDGTKTQQKVPGRDYVAGNRGATGYPRGALVNLDRTPAVVHCPDPTKLYIEHIKKGEYKIERFQGQFGESTRKSQPFRWDDMPDPTANEVEFDWHNKGHITKLNRWRNDRFVQITAVGKKEPNGGPFNKYEEEWLVSQEAMRTEEKFYERAGQDEQDAGITNPQQFQQVQEDFGKLANFPLPLGLSELRSLTNRFNNVFAGTRFYVKRDYKPCPNGTHVTRENVKDMGRVGEVPRPPRTMTEIKQHRCRIPAFSKHFMLKHDKSKFKDVQDESKLVSDIDSDFEQESGRVDPTGPSAAIVTVATQAQAGAPAQTGTVAVQITNPGPQTGSGAVPNANNTPQGNVDSGAGGLDNDEEEDDDDEDQEDEDMYGGS